MKGLHYCTATLWLDTTKEWMDKFRHPVEMGAVRLRCFGEKDKWDCGSQKIIVLTHDAVDDHQMKSTWHMLMARKFIYWIDPDETTATRDAWAEQVLNVTCQSLGSAVSSCAPYV